MTDGERLVWAASYAHTFGRGGDAITASRAATLAILELRAASIRRAPDGSYVICQIDERDFVDEIVTAP